VGIGRLQHLPQLALAYQAATTKCHVDRRSDITTKFATRSRLQPQTLSLQANWAPMDVGIRVVNLLLALDLLRMRRLNSIAHSANCTE
jgi:hypothetical protein